MITEDYVSFETAKLLKERGFNETCRAFWKEWNGEISLCDCNSSHTFEYCHNTMLENYNDSEETNIATPTHQMAMKWLREVHHITIGITFSCGLILYEIQKNEEFITSIGSIRTYEQMVEEAIQLCVKTLI